MEAEYDTQGFHQPRTKIMDNQNLILFLLLFLRSIRIFVKYEHLCLHIALTLSLPRTICEHWRACKQSFHQKFFCRYIYRRGSEARKKNSITNHKQKVRKV